MSSITPAALATGDQQLDHTVLLATGIRHDFVFQRSPVVLDLQTLQPQLQSLQMIVKQHRPALHHPQGFEDTITIGKSTIRNGQPVTKLPVYPFGNGCEIRHA